MVSKSGTNRTPKPPEYFTPEIKGWWKLVVATYVLDAHHILLLTAACEAWDRMQEARKTIAVEGAYYADRHGNHKAHGAVAVERDSRVAFARLLRELDLDVDPPKEATRPPQLSRYERR